MAGGVGRSRARFDQLSPLFSDDRSTADPRFRLRALSILSLKPRPLGHSEKVLLFTQERGIHQKMVHTKHRPFRLDIDLDF